MGRDEETVTSPDEQFTHAREVCGGVLSDVAARHLEEAARSDEFLALFHPGDPNDLESLLRVLHETEKYEEQFCRIYTPASDPAIPTVNFYFGWEPAELVEPVEESSLWDNPRAVPYDVGELATTLGPSGALLVFECSVEGREVHMLSSRLHVHPEAHPDDRIGLLQAVSRTVAGGLGCVEESGLTEAAPQPLPR
ncbi:hypothetical protein [Streptomyces marincola]|uniref:hypothetical protein n=1 Tax=Streptomyces marincola TaxID=2878388 RepID=UPI001CF195DE|nr:hypothetical protein [Streptomyces marincola]UCM90576.1 hypothetical protein LC193_23020 [Streptomyces marincola]